MNEFEILNRDDSRLRLLCITSQLICQNDAKQKFETLIRVPVQLRKFRYEKLVRVARRFYPEKKLVLDWNWFEANQS